jgi:WhiB family transcriptional regulator, redox-sensing transcriptional regulator
MFKYTRKQLELMKFKDNTWAPLSACKTDKVFTKEDKSEADIRHCKAVCKECPVRNECLIHALSFPEPGGIWGGLTHYERRYMRKGKLG